MSFSLPSRRFKFARYVRGFGLLEVILVFVVVLGAAIVTFVAYESAGRRSRVSEGIDQMDAIIANTRASSFAQANMATMTPDLAEKAYLVTPQLKINPWGGVNSIVGTSSTSFKIMIGQVATEDCATFILAVRNSVARRVAGPATIEGDTGTLAVPVGPLAPGNRCALVNHIDNIVFNVVLNPHT